MAEAVYVMVIPEWSEGLEEIERGIVKFGHLKDPENLEQRRNNLSRQYGSEFVPVYAVSVPDAVAVERLLRTSFVSRNIRVMSQDGAIGREFFDLDPGEAVSALKLLLIRNTREVKLPPFAQVKASNNRGIVSGRESKPERRLRKRSDIPVGAQLTFVPDPEITCRVAQQNPLRVHYGRSRNLRSLTDVTKEITTYDSVSGPLYWEYYGIRVSELPNN